MDMNTINERNLGNETINNTETVQQMQNIAGTKTKICPKCHTPLVEGQNFCSKCGSAVYCMDAVCTLLCSHCGAEITEEMRFCQKCGKEIVLQKQESVADKQINKKIISLGAAAIVIIMILAIIIGFAINKNKKPKGPDFEAIYNDICSPSWAEVGKDGSYLFVDSNPDNKDDGDYTYIFVVPEAIERINDRLGLPASLYSDMEKTTRSMGKQKETYEDLGVEVTWTYHPDKGLEVTYKLIAD